MNSPLRRVGIVLMVLFGLLFANLNWVQAYKADEYRSHSNNCRVHIAEYDRQRGPIVVGSDAQAAAVSEEADGFADVCDTGEPIRLRYLRTYPFDETYAHVVGYRPVQGEPTGIEGFENEFLTGTSDKLFVDRLRDVFTGGQTPGGNVVTTLSRPAQQTAFEQLRNNGAGAGSGAVVALDPRTGAVQAMVSLPSFDPDALVSHDLSKAAGAYEELDTDPDRPLLNRAVSETFHPGSVFKVIDSAAALQNGYTPETEIPAGSSYQPPQTTHEIRNAAPSICPQDEVTLARALTESCNTGFAQLGVELGADTLVETARAFGFGDQELRVGRLGDGGIKVEPSETEDMLRDDGQDDPPTVALSAIGQASVRITPMQGAMIAATVANGGVQMHPYLVEQLQGSDLGTVEEVSPEQLRTPVSGQVAGQLRDMMVSVVTDGTGRNAAIPDHVVGGKTGTAETGEDGDTHGWFIGFAMSDDEPVSAVAVLLENAGPGGSGEAARIAGQVMRAAIEDQGGG